MEQDISEILSQEALRSGFEVTHPARCQRLTPDLLQGVHITRFAVLGKTIVHVIAFWRFPVPLPKPEGGIDGEYYAGDISIDVHSPPGKLRSWLAPTIHERAMKFLDEHQHCREFVKSVHERSLTFDQAFGPDLVWASVNYAYCLARDGSAEASREALLKAQAACKGRDHATRKLRDRIGALLEMGDQWHVTRS